MIQTLIGLIILIAFINLIFFVGWIISLKLDIIPSEFYSSTSWVYGILICLAIMALGLFILAGYSIGTAITTQCN
jgi:protein-S-isoprenylcysteine O-methyltransferase Ste14